MVDSDGYRPLKPFEKRSLNQLRVFFRIFGIRVSHHVGERIGDRRININKIKRAFRFGYRYFDWKHRSVVYLYGRTAVPVKNGVVTTVYDDVKRPKARWQRDKYGRIARSMGVKRIGGGGPGIHLR